MKLFNFKIHLYFIEVNKTCSYLNYLKKIYNEIIAVSEFE